MARKRYQKGSVYLDGDKWKGRYRDDEITSEGTKRVRKEVILGCKPEMTKPLAERQMEKVLSRINAFNYRPGQVATFGEFIERWKTEVLTQQKPSSVRAVKSHLKCHIVLQLNRLRLEQFGVENQQAFITCVAQKGVSRKTVENIVGTLSSILSTARDWNYNCEQIDKDKLRFPQRGVPFEAPRFTVGQMKQILSLAEEPWHTLFCVLTFEGLRAGEVLGLQWGDIDLDRQLLQVRRSAWYGKIQTTKSQTSETTLPIPNALVRILREYRANWQPNPHGFLFVTRNGRPPSSNNVVEHHLWIILDALGFPRCGLHAFRHSHTALLLDSGATPKVVQRQLRHADACTTLEIYGHVVGDAHREAVEKVASKLELDAIGRQLTTIN
jgi:integrase